jgi:hypothetical protein
MKVYNCTTCGTELKRYEAVLRGNAIDAEPTAWCRLHGVAAGVLHLPTPEPTEAPRIPAPRPPSLLRQRLGQR